MNDDVVAGLHHFDGVRVQAEEVAKTHYGAICSGGSATTVAGTTAAGTPATTTGGAFDIASLKATLKGLKEGLVTTKAALTAAKAAYAKACPTAKAAEVLIAATLTTLRARAPNGPLSLFNLQSPSPDLFLLPPFHLLNLLL